MHSFKIEVHTRYTNDQIALSEGAKRGDSIQPRHDRLAHISTWISPTRRHIHTIWLSRKTMSYTPASLPAEVIFSNATCPFSAVSTTHPIRLRLRSISLRVRTSSSTTSTCKPRPNSILAGFLDCVNGEDDGENDSGNVFVVARGARFKKEGEEGRVRLKGLESSDIPRLESTGRRGTLG